MALEIATHFGGAILGSTPHELLHLSDRPVLVVRADDAAGLAPPDFPSIWPA